MFEELKGIQAARKVKPAIKGNLEKLVELSSQVEGEFENRTYFICENRPELYERVKKADIEYDEQDIQSLVVALSSQETQNPIVRGVYTGALVSLLTEKNNKEGRKTILKFDLWQLRPFPSMWSISMPSGKSINCLCNEKLFFTLPKRCDLHA